MSTVNISLPTQQIAQIDSFMNKYGFANRSEFFRSLLRLISNKPALLEEAATFPMKSPKTATISEIMKDFKNTNKYSSDFLSDLEKGLKQSKYFNS